MSQNYSVARVEQYTDESIGKAERHLERKNTTYENMNVDLSRTPMNVHYRSCGELTYLEHMKQLVEEGTVSLRGLKKDAKVFDEMVLDVNTAYFEERGGYDFACRFFEEAARFAEKEYGPENVISSVMHADELNTALTEQLGHPVYHYHLHVVALPVVEKEIRWSKRCKDLALVGTVKEVIHQISHSKKWAARQEKDEKGFSHPVKSYSLLQDRFFAHMREAGFEGFERGQPGSTAKHLADTEYKVQKEKERLEALQAKSREVEMGIVGLEEEKVAAENELQDVSAEIGAAQQRLDELTPRIKDAEAFMAANLENPAKLLPEAGPLERGGHYREEKALPILKKLWNVALSLYHKLQKLRREHRALQNRYDSVSSDRDYYRSRLETADEENNSLKEALQDFDRVKQELGPDQVSDLLARSKAREAAERERKAAEKEAQRAAKRAARSRWERDAR